MEKILKAIKNYWYYYKPYVITGVLVLAVVIYSFANSGEGEKFDRYAALISSAPYREEEVKALQDAFAAQFGSFGVRVYTIELGALNQDQAVLAKLDLDLGQRLSDTLLLEDVEAFREATNGLPVSEPVPVSSVPYLSGLGFDDLYLVTRE